MCASISVRLLGLYRKTPSVTQAYGASNDRATVNNELERMWEKAVVAYPGIYLQGLRKPTQTPFGIVGLLVEIRIEHLPNYNSKALPLEPTCLIVSACLTRADFHVLTVIMLTNSMLQCVLFHQHLIVMAVHMHKEFSTVMKPEVY
jgi:hypothetical protein